MSCELLAQRLAPQKEMDIWRYQIVIQNVLRDPKFGHSLTIEDMERMEDEAVAVAAAAAAAATAAECDSEDTDEYDNEDVNDLEDKPVT